MNASPQRVLIISPESWGKSWLSKHHYALELLRTGSEVWFLNSPLYKTGDLSETIEKDFPGLHILDDDLPRGLSRMPRFWRRHKVKSWIERKQKQLDVKWDWIWSFDNSRLFDLDLFSGAVRIHHLVDYGMNFHLKEACSNADMCLAVTPKLTASCLQWNPESHFLQHGLQSFQAGTSNIKNVGYNHHIGYVGNLLHPLLDLNALLEVIQNCPGAHFHLIGSYGKGHLNPAEIAENNALEKMRRCSNATLYGEMEYHEAMHLAGQCDLLLSCYFQNGKSAIDNSSKIMACIATGKIVVSNAMNAYPADAMRHAATTEEFKLLITDTLANLNFWNDEAKQQERKKYAEQFFYSNQLMRIKEWVSRIP